MSFSLFLTVVLVVLSHVVGFISSSEMECSSYMIVIQASHFLGFNTYLKKTSHSVCFLFRYCCRGTIVWMRIKNEQFLESIFWHRHLKPVSQRLKQLYYVFPVYSQVFEVIAFFLCVCLVFTKYLHGQKADWSEMFSFSSLCHNVTTYTTLRSRMCSVEHLWQDAELLCKHLPCLRQESELPSTSENEALL